MACSAGVAHSGNEYQGSNTLSAMGRGVSIPAWPGRTGGIFLSVAVPQPQCQPPLARDTAGSCRTCVTWEMSDGSYREYRDRQAAGDHTAGSVLSLRELAERPGWQHAILGHYESGRHVPPVSRLIDIAHALGHTPAALVLDSLETVAVVARFAANVELSIQVAYVLETLEEPIAAGLADAWPRITPSQFAVPNAWDRS